MGKYRYFFDESDKSGAMNDGPYTGGILPLSLVNDYYAHNNGKVTMQAEIRKNGFLCREEGRCLHRLAVVDGVGVE